MSGNRVRGVGLSDTANQPVWRQEFPPEAQAVRDARSFVVGSPAASGVDPDLLAMAVSELASNAVLHARSSFTVSSEGLPDGVRVEVSDGSDVVPRPRQPEPSRVTGRGLMIVAEVSRAWGVRRIPTGKVVWFEMGRATT
jgi:anti-sigma regulatory factor (Ser/Thr protein kinase)